jgi:hypothetical protein
MNSALPGRPAQPATFGMLARAIGAADGTGGRRGGVPSRLPGPHCNAEPVWTSRCSQTGRAKRPSLFALGPRLGPQVSHSPASGEPGVLDTIPGRLPVQNSRFWLPPPEFPRFSGRIPGKTARGPGFPRHRRPNREFWTLWDCWALSKTPGSPLGSLGSGPRPLRRSMAGSAEPVWMILDMGAGGPKGSLGFRAPRAPRAHWAPRASRAPPSAWRTGRSVPQTAPAGAEVEYVAAFPALPRMLLGPGSVRRTATHRQAENREFFTLRDCSALFKNSRFASRTLGFGPPAPGAIHGRLGRTGLDDPRSVRRGRRSSGSQAPGRFPGAGLNPPPSACWLGRSVPPTAPAGAGVEYLAAFPALLATRNRSGPAAAAKQGGPNGPPCLLLGPGSARR